MKFLGNYRKLIDFIKAELHYAPPNPKLSVAAMEAHYLASLASAQDVGDKLGPHKLAISARQEAFALLAAQVTRSRNVLKAAGVSQQVLDKVETAVRKILGRRKSEKVKDDPATPANEATVTHSASQTSFENQVGNFRALLAIYGAVPEYQPNDSSLKLTALTAVADDLQAKTDGVSLTFVPLSQARALRDQLLYLAEDCVANRALLVKAYIAGESGTKSNVYKQIKGLKFQRGTRS